MHISFQFQDTHFIRCIKPNEERIPGKFDEEYVSRQLKCFSVIAYAKFIQNCYPIKVSFDVLREPYEQFIQTSDMVHQTDDFRIISKNFFRKLLVSCGFEMKDFRVGEHQIFFRESQKHLARDILKNDQEAIERNIAKMKRFRARSRWRKLGNLYLFIKCMLIYLCLRIPKFQLFPAHLFQIYKIHPVNVKKRMEI